MAAAMEFCLLGPFEARRCTGSTLVPRGKQRVVLAALLLHANRVVPVGELCEALWGQAPPRSARVTLQNHVKRLRQAMGQDAGRVRTYQDGYLVQVSEDELDAARFEALVGSARMAVTAGSWERASVQATMALDLWRGEPLTDVDSEVLSLREAPRLVEMHQQALQTRLDADVRLGRHAEVLPELRRVTQAYPLRENFHALLMLALYRNGCQGEALAAYQVARRLLREELGTEPGAGLREMHQRILASDVALAVPGQTPTTAGSAARVVPRELPGATGYFVGREDELATLTELMKQLGTATPKAVVISAIWGMPGVGKTALALFWAHQVEDRFADGQLYVNLRGFDPSGNPVASAEAVRGFLAALGVPPESIPRTADARAGLYRTMTARKQMLIVLDNARDEQQVRPLLPASPASLVIVTSRNQLPGLAVGGGARLLCLDVLTHDEAVQLLTARLGIDRVAAEAVAIDQIATLCARLPLALAVAAARAAARPRFPLIALAAELRDAADRLDALEAGDPATNVTAVFSWSYQQLSPAAAQMFRLLGLHPGPDISVPAAASLAGIDQAEARRLLRDLARDCLISEHAPGRYAFHDLLRAYAANKAGDTDSQPNRDAATGRVLDHYLHTAGRAALLLRPSDAPLALAAPRPGTAPEQPADHRQAMSWFEAEHHVLLAVVAFATERGADSQAWQLPWAMKEYLLRRGYPHERMTLFGSALAAAERLDDTLGQAMALRALGQACTGTGNYSQAHAHLERCILLYQRLGDHVGEAWALHSLSILAEVQGRYTEALGHNEQALRLFRASGRESEEAEMLNNVGWFHALLGDYQRARTFCGQSLALIANLSGCDFAHVVWDTLGYIEFHLGDFARARAHFEYALDLCRDYGDRYTEAEILEHLGDTHHEVGELPQARQAWQQALAIYEAIYHPAVEKIRAKLART